MSEDEIAYIKQCQSGDKETFDILYRRYRGIVMKIAREMMGSESEVEDVVQEVFTRAFAKIKQFRHESSLSSWLGAIAINTCKDILRSRSCHPTDSLDSMVEDGKLNVSKDLSVTQEEELIMNELLENVQEKISHLRRDYQKLIVLRYIDGLSYEKIAQLLGYSQSLVKSRLHQARRELCRICKSLEY